MIRRILATAKGGMAQIAGTRIMTIALDDRRMKGVWTDV
jgi:hypothetical protein